MHLALNAYFWNQPHTGTGQYTRQLVRWLDRLVSDLRISLVVPQPLSEQDKAAIPTEVSLVVAPARSGHLGKVYFEQLIFPRACRSLGVDLAHVPYWGSPLQSSVPLAVTIHDITTLLVRQYRQGLRSRLYTALVSASAQSATHVITDSKASSLDIQRHLDIVESGITSIYLAAGHHFNPNPDLLMDMAIIGKYDLPQEYVLYLGGFETHKNLLTLLSAYTYVHKAVGSDIPLVLAGRRPQKKSDHFPDYQKHITELKLEEIVRWTGFIDEADKPAVYRRAKCFAFPSRYEGFGLPPLEAMACGVPVVASKSASLPEVIGSAGYTIDPDDYRQFGGSIIATLVQEELAAELRRKGLEQAAKFSWADTAAETAAVYDHIASNI